MASEAKLALTNEIQELKKNRRGLEKEAYKVIKTIMESSDAEDKKREEKLKVKKEMKEELISTKKILREKINELGSL